MPPEHALNLVIEIVARWKFGDIGGDRAAEIRPRLPWIHSVLRK